MKSQNLPVKALLLLDNAPSHPLETELRTRDGSITTMFMPPNVTPLIQPMDQNAIRITKLYYRKYLLSTILSQNPDNVGSSLKNVTLKDAILNLVLAWDSLEQSVIEKCWRNILSQDDEDDLPLSVLRENLRSNVINVTVSEVTTMINSIID